MDNTAEITRILDNRRNKTAADRIVLKCGIRADLKGFTYLAEAAVLYGNDVVGFNEIYRRLGARHGVQSKSIMREITYAIKGSPDVLPRLAELTGKTVAANASNSVVIQCLGMMYCSARDAAACCDEWS